MRRWSRPIGALTTTAIIVLTAGDARAQAPPSAAPKPPAVLERPARIAGHPDLNGIWQALNTAYWNRRSPNFSGRWNGVLIR
jgi:hypothetical protein